MRLPRVKRPRAYKNLFKGEEVGGAHIRGDSSNGLWRSSRLDRFRCPCRRRHTSGRICRGQSTLRWKGIPSVFGPGQPLPRKKFRETKSQTSRLKGPQYPETGIKDAWRAWGGHLGMTQARGARERGRDSSLAGKWDGRRCPSLLVDRLSFLRGRVALSDQTAASVLYIHPVVRVGGIRRFYLSRSRAINFSGFGRFAADVFISRI